MKLKLLTTAFSLLSLVLVTAFGHEASIVPSSPTIIPTVVKPQLASFQVRVSQNNALPLWTAQDVHGATVSIKGVNILYLAPNETYAISQYAAIWSQLKHVPTVVWTDTTASLAVQEWSSEGYTKDPLPSSTTYFSSHNIPTPDSYHRMETGWRELPGVLPAQETSQWLSFFDNGH